MGKIKLVYIPEWAGVNFEPTHINFDYDSITINDDVNNYLLSQYDFFLELLGLDSTVPFTNPYEVMGVVNYADIFALLMHHSDLVSLSPTFDVKETTARALIQNACAKLNDSRNENNLYIMGDNAEVYVSDEESPKTLTGKRVFKRYMELAFNNDEKILFINMTNTPSSSSFKLDISSHYNLRLSAIEAMLTFLKDKVDANTQRGDAKNLSRRFPTLSRWYHQLLSDMD